MIWVLAAALMTSCALAIAIYETFAHLGRQPANDDGAPKLDARLRVRMRSAALLLVLALGSLILAPPF